MTKSTSQHTSLPDRNFRLIYIEWVDSTAEVGSAWNDLDDTLKACQDMEENMMLCKTAGFLLHEDETSITITLSHHNSECGPYITIPIECVRKQLQLEKRAWQEERA